jgi:hypothetical protein
MHQYHFVLREFFELVFKLWFERIEEELQRFAEALDQWLHDLFQQPTQNWRDGLAQFLAEQEAAGRMPTPESRQDLLTFLEGWEMTVDWQAVEGTSREDDRTSPKVLAAPEWPMAGATLWIEGGFPRDRGKTLNGGRRPFLRRLQDASNHLKEMERVLQALAQRLDAAKANEEIEVETEVDTIEKLIWRYNDAMESARRTWLRYDLRGDAFDRLAKMSSPPAFNLPRFVDEQQAERARIQWKQISERVDRRTTTLDEIILAAKVVEYAGTGASLLVGGTVLFQAVRSGGKWAVVKSVGQVATSGAVAYGTGKAVEHGLRAAGASEESIHGVILAAEVVTWLLLLRRVNAGRARAKQRPTEPLAPRQPQIENNRRPLSTDGSQSQGTGLVPTVPAVLGEWGEIRLRHLFGGRGFKPKSAYKTNYGKRFVDWMVDGVAHEAKAGLNVGLTTGIREQVLKDSELIKSKRIRGAHWHFFQGAKKELLDFITGHGIQYTVH